MELELTELELTELERTEKVSSNGVRFRMELDSGGVVSAGMRFRGG